MGFFTGIGDFFRGAFGEDDEEKRRRKEREAREAAARRAAQNQPSPQQNWNNQQNQRVQQFFGQKQQPNAPKLTDKQVKKPLLQQEAPPPPPAPRAAPLPDQQFLGISEDKGKNKTIFGWNAAALLPKNLEKTYEVKANRKVQTNADKYVAQFDKLNPDYQKVLVNEARKRAQNKRAADGSEMPNSGDPEAINTLRALERAGRLKGGFREFAEGANERLGGGTARAGMRLADFVLPGKNTFGLERLADQQDPEKNNTRQFTERGKQGETFGTVEKGIVDLASLALPVGDVDKVMKSAKLVRSLEDGTKIMKLGGVLIKIAPGSLAGTGIDYLQQRGRGEKPDLVRSAGVGLGIDLAVDAAPAIVRPGLKKLFGNKGAVVEEAAGGATTALSKADPEVKQAIEDAIGDNTPSYLRKELAGDAEKVGADAKGSADDAVSQAEKDLETLAKDENAPPYQRKQAQEELAARRKAAEAAKNAEDPLMKPTYQHKQEIAAVIKSEHDKLLRVITENPNLSRQQIEAAQEAAQQRTIKLVQDLQESRRAGLEAVDTQGKVIDEAATKQGEVKAAVQAEQAAKTAPPPETVGQAGTTPVGSPEVTANDAYDRFNKELGITPGSQDVGYVDAQQQLERTAGNKTLDDLSGRQMLRVPAQIAEKTQGRVASGVTDVAGKGTSKLITSQNPILNTIGQLFYGFNKKSTLSNEAKTLVEQVRGRRGGLGKLGEEVVSSLETPIKQLDEATQAAVKEKVFRAFELYNNGQIDESLALIKSFAPEERAYFDGIRELNILRNNLNRTTLSLDKVDEYANGMHMPRLFDQATFAKEFDDNAVEAWAVSQQKTLDLNPAKRRKQLDDLSEELRQEMLRDPAKASAIRTEIALHNKGVADYAASVSHLPGAVSDTPARGFLEIPDSPRYGNVAGKYIRKDLAEPMLSGDARFKSESYRAVNKLLDRYQTTVVGKIENGLRKILTAYNPATRLGNRGANLTQGALAGFNLPEMAVEQQHFINVLKNGGDEWTRLAKTFGAIDDNHALARFSGVVTEPKSGVLKRAGQSYADVDTAAKVAMFKWRIQKGASPEEAARFVNRALPNIGNSGEIYSFFSRLPVLGVPFRAIQPEVLRSVASSAGRNTVPFLVAMTTYTTLQNMSWDGVPEDERKQIQERFGSGQTPFESINRAVQGKTGLDLTNVFGGKEGDTKVGVLPSSWSINAAGIPGIGDLFGTDPETGDKKVVDVDPRRLMGMYSINLGGDSPADSIIDQALKASPANIPATFNNGDWQFAPQNIVGSRVFSPAYQAIIDRDFRGKSVQDPEGKIYNPDGSISYKYMNPDTGRPEWKQNTNRLLQFLGRSYVPQASDIANIKDAADGKENFYGQKMTIPQTIGRLFGLKGEEFSDKRLKDMRDTAQFFNERDEIEKEVAGMSQASAEAYKRLTGYYKLRDQKVPNEFSPGEMRDKKAPQYEFGEDKWKEYAAHPELYQLMVNKKKRENQPKPDGKPGAPIQPEFDERLSLAFRKQLIQNKMVAPGDDAELDQRMYSSPEFDYYMALKDKYKEEAKKYYPDNGDDFTDELVKHQDSKFPDKPEILKQYGAAYGEYSDGKRTEKPEFTDAVKAAKEQYTKETFDWTNKERKARGLPAITWEVWNNPTFGYDESKSGGFGYGYGRGGGGGGGNGDYIVNNLGNLTDFTKSVNRLDPIQAAAMPQLAQLFAGLQAGKGGGKAIPRLGASASGR